MLVSCVDLVPEEKGSLTSVFKKSYEYEEIQASLEPLLSKASNESRHTAPQYNTHFPWQVAYYSHISLQQCNHNGMLLIHPFSGY